MFIKHLQKLLTPINSNFVFKNCLFSAIKITNTTNSDTDKWKYSGYGIGFDSKGEFAYPDGGDGKNVIIFGADLGNSKHANNKIKHVLVLGREFIQKINDTTIYTEKMYSPNFTVDNKIVCIIMVTIVIYLLMANKLLTLRLKTLN